jgi:hypothetical protein
MAHKSHWTPPEEEKAARMPKSFGIPWKIDYRASQKCLKALRGTYSKSPGFISSS